MSSFKELSQALQKGIQGLISVYFSCRRDRFGYISETAFIRPPFFGSKNNIFIYENCSINGFFRIASQRGSFIMKRNCSVGPGLTVITANHKYDEVGIRPETGDWGIGIPDDVIVNEDVWIGANVTLCPGVKIGRGCIVAAGSVCVKSKTYPPYSIIGGNPAKFLKFRLSIVKQIEQEELLYKENERIPIAELKENYNKFNKNE